MIRQNRLTRLYRLVDILPIAGSAFVSLFAEHVSRYALPVFVLILTEVAVQAAKQASRSGVKEKRSDNHALQEIGSGVFAAIN